MPRLGRDTTATFDRGRAPSDARPRLADGVELIGEYEGSGFREPPSLARRADGQVIQLTPLLYKVAERCDGEHDTQQIADEVAADISRGVSAANIETLVEHKLRPLGMLVASDGSQPDVHKVDPLLALKFRAAVVPEWLSNAFATVFRPLFFPPVIVAVLAGLVVVDGWVFFHHGVAQAVRQALYSPGVFLLMFGMVVVSAAFHEMGHATACRYSGASPGRMGCGLYLAWPAFYTDVTDAYRLGKRGRLRTDLGGVYFNVVFILATMGAYLATRYEPLLLLLIIEHVEIAHQLLPVVRLDGYYIVADLTGVPDLFTRIKPILLSLVPGRKPDDRVKVLKPWVRFAVTAWVLIVVPILALQMIVILAHLPRIIGTAWDSGHKQMADITKAFGDGHALHAVSGIVQLIALALPIVGIVLMIVRVAQRLAVTTWERTEGRPVLRVLAVGAGVAACAVLVDAWTPAQHHYKPIGPRDRGTVQQGLREVRLRRLPLVGTVGTVRTPTPGRSKSSVRPGSPTTTSVVVGGRHTTTTTVAGGGVGSSDGAGVSGDLSPTGASSGTSDSASTSGDTTQTTFTATGTGSSSPSTTSPSTTDTTTRSSTSSTTSAPSTTTTTSASSSPSTTAPSSTTASSTP